METVNLLKQIAQLEIDNGCYNAKIDGLSLYSLERDDLRLSYQEKMGAIVMNNHQRINKFAVVSSAIKSCWHILKLLSSNKTVDTIIFPFARVDKINGIYLDKFTDPVIDESGLFGEDYILMDHGRAGVHPKPRIHEYKIAYIDILHILADLKGRLFYKRFVKKHQSVFDIQKSTISKAFGDESYNSIVERKMVVAFFYVKMLRSIFKHLKPKRIMQPARVCAPIAAAHSLGIKTYEFQHGVTYGESSLYSGYQDIMVVPDYFLAFGENKPIDVYGIDESKIVNVGWALWDYLEKNDCIKKYGKDDVLVVSEPQITDVVFKIVLKLAQAFPDSNFYLRPHPHEVINKKHLDIIKIYPNVSIQDRSINIMEVMMGFENIVGENSTVLYEALSMNKKVGKLFFEGLHPIYLEENDRESFWEIRSIDDMNAFINDTNANKKPKSIYSPFNKELFEKTVFGQGA